MILFVIVYIMRRAIFADSLNLNSNTSPIFLDSVLNSFIFLDLNFATMKSSIQVFECPNRFSIYLSVFRCFMSFFVLFLRLFCGFYRWPVDVVSKLIESILSEMYSRLNSLIDVNFNINNICFNGTTCWNMIAFEPEKQIIPHTLHFVFI